MPRTHTVCSCCLHAPVVESQKEGGVGVPTPPAVLPTRVTVAVAEPVSQKKVLPTRGHVAVAEPVSQKKGGVGVPTPPAVLPTSVPVDVASPLSHVVCSLGPVDVSTGPAVLEHSSSSSPVPGLRGLVDTSVDQSRPNCTKNACGGQLEKCGLARAVEPVRAELSSNLSGCGSARALEPVRAELSSNPSGCESSCALDPGHSRST